MADFRFSVSGHEHGQRCSLSALDPLRVVVGYLGRAFRVQQHVVDRVESGIPPEDTRMADPLPKLL